MKINLKTQPKFTRYDRSPLAEGASPKAIEGGKFGAGMIPSVSLITHGEALGHGAWIDAEFLSQVSTALQAKGEQGLKSRFTHPGMSSDGLGRMLGRINNGRLEGSQVIGDLHYVASARNTPDGDLVDYTSMLIEEDPTAAGLSIVFGEDMEAMVAFAVEHGAEVVDDPYYGEYLDLENFKSPDPENVNNYIHVRLAELRAADLVDEPAANPNGMFDSAPVARNIDQALAFALGLDDTKPDNAELFGVDVDRASAFAKRFLSSRGLSIVTTKTPESLKPEAEGGITREQFAAELSKFTTKFGAENGVKWFNEGKSYSEALELHCEALAVELKSAKDKATELQGKFDSLQLGEKNPVDTGSQADADKKAEKVSFAKATGLIQ